MLISLVGKSGTGLATTENIQKDKVASYFLKRLKCDACLVWVQLTNTSIIVWSPSNELRQQEFIGDVDLLNELDDLKQKFDSTRAAMIADSMAFELPISDDNYLKNLLETNWENKLSAQLNREENKDGYVKSEQSEAGGYAICYFVGGEFLLATVPVNELISTDNDQLKTLLNLDAQWRVAYQQYVNSLNLSEAESEFDWLKCVTVRGIDPTNAYRSCQGMTFDECQSLLRESMYYWIQDRFNTVEYDSITKLTNIQSNFLPRSGDGISISHVGAEFIGTHCRNLKGIPGNTIIQGGDILFSKDFVLIGRDVLNHYLDNKNLYAYEQIGLDSTTNIKDSIEKRLKEELHLNGREIIWVGTNDARDTYDLRHPKGPMPLFHIDMFLTLGPIKEHKGKKCITYLLGIPELVNSGTSLEPNMKNVIRYLADWVKQCRDSLNSTLRKIGYETEVIEIPLPIYLVGYVPPGPNVGPDLGWRYNVSHYHGFNNGLMECIGDSCTYFMPELDTSEIPPHYSSWGERIKVILNSAGISVEPVFNSIQPNAAIHCRVKVLKRD